MCKPLPLQSPVLRAYESRCRFYGSVFLSYRLNPCTESAGRGKGAGVVSKVVNVVKLFFTPAFSGHFAPQKRAATITAVLHYWKCRWLHEVQTKRAMSRNVSLICGPFHLILCMILLLRNAMQSQGFKWHLLFGAFTAAALTNTCIWLCVVKPTREITKTHIYIYFKPCLCNTLSRQASLSKRHADRIHIGLLWMIWHV